MNELTKVKQRILERIETYIGDIEFAQEQELTEDEKTIFESIKHIINEEFEQPIPLPRFIIHANGEIEQIKAADKEQAGIRNDTVMNKRLNYHIAAYSTDSRMI